MFERRWTKRGAVLVLLLIGLSACASLFERPLPGACPKVSILRDAERVFAFRPGDGRDLTDVVYQSQMQLSSALCQYVDDDRTIEMRLTMLLATTRGPAARQPNIDLPYFVAVIGGDGAILAKQVFDSPMAFEDGQRRAIAQEETDQRIPLPEGSGGQDFEIIVGFQLSKAQLAYNRQLRGR